MNPRCSLDSTCVCCHQGNHSTKCIEGFGYSVIQWRKRKQVNNRDGFRERFIAPHSSFTSTRYYNSQQHALCTASIIHNTHINIVLFGTPIILPYYVFFFPLVSQQRIHHPSRFTLMRPSSLNSFLYKDLMIECYLMLHLHIWSEEWCMIMVPFMQQWWHQVYQAIAISLLKHTAICRDIA